MPSFSRSTIVERVGHCPANEKAVIPNLRVQSETQLRSTIGGHRMFSRGCPDEIGALRRVPLQK